MESWRKVWREGITPELSTRGLQRLRKALKEDDVRLIQGTSTVPPALDFCRKSAPCGACGIGFCAWMGDGLDTVAEVESFVDHVCAQADQQLGEPCISRYFIDWFDAAPRTVVRELLLEEVELALELRDELETEETVSQLTAVAAA